MPSKFYIYKSGRWLQLDIATGTLEGTREKPQFLYVRDGTLQLARRSSILRGLAALQVGRPTTVKDGLSLPSRRKHRRHYRSSKIICSHQCCSTAQTHSCPTPITINSIRQDVTTSTTNYVPGVAIPQTKQVQTFPKTDEAVKETVCQSMLKQPNNCLSSTSKETPVCQPMLQHQHPINCLSSTSKDDSSDSRESPIKELLIDIDDVKYIRDYLAKHPKLFGHIDREKFDVDHHYRNVMLFKLNPLVKLVKKGNLGSRIYKEHIKPPKEMSQKEFAATLGLTHIDDRPVNVKRAYRTRQKLEKPTNGNVNPKKKDYSKFFQISSRDSDDKENSSASNRQKGSKSAGILTQGRKSMDNKKMLNGISKSDEKGTDDSREKNRNVFKKKNMMLRKSNVGKKYHSGVREYSSLEDHAIVAWVSGGGGGRERRVNGNRLWRELAREYAGITGLERSWHSLRNRYLRYILPALGSLRLEPQHESKLRAAAAKGEIKLSRKRSLNRRNSIHSAAPVRSAWSRRPKHDGNLSQTDAADRSLARGAHDSSGQEESTPASRKSQTASTKSPVRQSSPDGKSPARRLRSNGGMTYSAITEAFAKRRLGSSSGSGQASPPPSPPPATKPGRRLFNHRAIRN